MSVLFSKGETKADESPNKETAEEKQEEDNDYHRSDEQVNFQGDFLGPQLVLFHLPRLKSRASWVTSLGSRHVCEYIVLGIFTGKYLFWFPPQFGCSAEAIWQWCDILKNEWGLLDSRMPWKYLSL